MGIPRLVPSPSRFSRRSFVFVGPAALLTSLGAARNDVPGRPAALAAIEANDNTTSAGRLAGGVLTVRLEARMGTWRPEGPGSTPVDVAAWGEEGKELRNPGPMIRVREGTEVRATLRNTLTKPLTVYGFGATRGTTDSVVLKPGEVREVSFKATTRGTYYYAGKTIPAPIVARVDEDSQLNGAILVDPPSGPPPRDRVFVISWWGTVDSTSRTGLGRFTMTINGLSWPHTERIDMVQGDSVHWRVINLTALPHPMHLHGFYFKLVARGNGARDSLIAPSAQSLAVTEIVDAGRTMALTWAPTKPGNWIWHCHFAGHLSHLVALDSDKGNPPTTSAESHHGSDRPHQMYGLVIGMRVTPRANAVVAQASAPRALRMLVRSKPNVFGKEPGYAFVLGGTPEEANVNAIPIPGPTLVLERGKPVAVTIVNRSHEPAAIHWHGIELESYPDGVPGWSGSRNTVLPAIKPGDSLTVRFTPPRAGTFMYHSHFNEFQQITSGLYAPLIVVEPGTRLDPQTDHVMIFGDDGPTINVIRGPYPPAALNGKAGDQTMELRAGVTHRFRVINIRGDFPIFFALREGDRPIQWKAVAKDGADLPTALRTMRPAVMVSAPGEIYDFEWTPSGPTELTLQFGLPEGIGLPPEKALVTIRVR